ncbi:DUF483 domain-containing protein [Candidatus Woesearchaeota archaeon]|nr:DUF483 domain-containing protein [Candidatus Woesearchaeota archaeon]
MIGKLLKVFYSHTRSLEMLYLIDGIKKAVRLDANYHESEKIKKFCHDQKLFLELSDFKVIKAPDAGKGGYANIVKRLPISHSEDGLYHLYISRDKNIAKFLKILENKNDDRSVGELLGYPKCCIDFFMKNRERQQKIQNDYILPTLENSNGFKFPFYTNYAMRYFDITLLSHFPHDFNCKESIAIAKKNLECIKKFDKTLAGNFENMLRNAILYTENEGVFVFKNYRLENNILEYNEILPTEKNELFKLLNQNEKIEIISKNKIKTGNKILDNAGFMVFT